MTYEPQPAVDLRRIAELASLPAQIVPIGEHLFQCVSAEWAVSRADNPMIKGRWVVAPGRPAAGISAYAVQVVTETPQRARALMAFFAAHEVDPTAAVSPQDVVEQLAGRFVWATVEHEMFNGESRARLTRFRAHSFAERPQPQPPLPEPPPPPTPQPQPQPQPLAQPQPQPPLPEPPPQIAQPWQPPQQPQPLAQPQPQPPLPEPPPQIAQPWQPPQQPQPLAQPQPQPPLPEPPPPPPPEPQPTQAERTEEARARVASMLQSESR